MSNPFALFYDNTNQNLELNNNSPYDEMEKNQSLLPAGTPNPFLPGRNPFLPGFNPLDNKTKKLVVNNPRKVDVSAPDEGAEKPKEKKARRLKEREKILKDIKKKPIIKGILDDKVFKKDDVFEGVDDKIKEEFLTHLDAYKIKFPGKPMSYYFEQFKEDYTFLIEQIEIEIEEEKEKPKEPKRPEEIEKPKKIKKIKKPEEVEKPKKSKKVKKVKKPEEPEVVEKPKKIKKVKKPKEPEVVEKPKKSKKVKGIPKKSEIDKALENVSYDEEIKEKIKEAFLLHYYNKWMWGSGGYPEKSVKQIFEKWKVNFPDLIKKIEKNPVYKSVW